MLKINTKYKGNSLCGSGKPGAVAWVMKNRILAQCLNVKAMCQLIILLNLVISFHSVSSPWVEADDPYFRSDLQVMADSGLLLMPTNSYPVRWSLFSDQFSNIDIQHMSKTEELAYRSVQYRLDSEKLGRGRSHLTLGGATDTQAGNNGFGGYLRTKAGINASHEVMVEQFAFRVASGYRQAKSDEDNWNFDHSYFAVASHDISLSIGWLDRWWGPGWQHTSGLAQQSSPIPAFSLSYQQPQIPILGSLWFETLIAKQDNEAKDDYLSASRLSLRPVAFLQLGGTYKSWFGGNSGSVLSSEWMDAITTDNDNGLYSFDGRLSALLPLNGSGGLYAEQGKTRGDTLKYQIIGADAQWLVGKQSMRLVVENATQQVATSSYYGQVLQHQRSSILSMPADQELSVGSYWQLSTDQQLSLFVHKTELDNREIKRISTQIKQPAFAGLITLNMSFIDHEISGQDRNIFGINYEYRFN
ncbi:capsule assembly Wzi family protein [uncultured Tolumonas sp.]|uniref:capsule assembly Wzi family protein n=1 Tax=uncultured Tolumonas sp. TaxID=263765 RepID=UPI0029311E19|nr:capsule assembly Wzi family protein [uncultured Tolumonas sp.]